MQKLSEMGTVKMKTQKQKVRFGDFVVTIIHNDKNKIQTISPLKEEIRKNK
jgi:hypothetical protein